MPPISPRSVWLRPLRLLPFLLVAVVLLSALFATSSAVAATFDSTKILSDDNMRDWDCMTQADIQAFLNLQPGPLKSLVTTDHAQAKDGVGPTKTKKSAAQIIYEACQQWHISPKVMLTDLQKEQGLLSGQLGHPLDVSLAYAIGAGVPGDGSNHYPGFGSQMWFGARLLDGYGEGKNGSSIPLWKAPYTVYDGQFKTMNLATYKLYVYTPSKSGNQLFWSLYRKYFGDTFADPRIRGVYRYRDVKTGAYLYTARIGERYQLTNNTRYAKEGLAFSWDASNTANSIPVYRFMNRKTHGYLFTASPAAYKRYTSASLKKKWRYEGVAFMGSAHVTGSVPVYEFKNKKTGLFFLTISAKGKAKFQSAAYAKKWTYSGIPYWICP